MLQENNDILWPMARASVECIVEYAKEQPSIEAARPFIGLLEKQFRGVNNKDAFELIDSITQHFKEEWKLVMRQQADKQSLTDTLDFDTYPALRLLATLVNDGRTPKDTLMPLRAAMDAGALLPPMSNVVDFNRIFGTKLSPSNYSTYINAPKNPYESEHDVRRYRTLKKQFKEKRNDKNYEPEDDEFDDDE